MHRPIEDIMGELKAALAAQTEARDEKTTGKPRHVSKMAKNLVPGDMVDLPYYGWTELNAWMRNGDYVLLGDGAMRQVTVGADERLTVRRS